ncbi:MAG: DUF1080 domain-containing protein [Bacteroidota bacterium]
MEIILKKVMPYLALLLCISCGYKSPVNNLRMVEQNGLSAADKAVGWQSLFDGTEITKWRVYQEEGMRGWEVRDGAMWALGMDGKPADIVTIDTFKNFELSLEWTTSEKGNSGIFFNVREDAELPAVYHTGPEYQLIDNEGYGDAIQPGQKSGANYDMHPPRYDVTLPPGNWNKSRLIVDQGHVQHWMNGKKIVEYELWTPEWEDLRSKAKWKDYPKYGVYSSGHIALQDHGNRTGFRNLKVRRLD